MKGMKRMMRLAVAVPAWLALWLVLAGADRGCYIIHTDCESLNEQACAADDSCQAVYGYDDSIFMDGDMPLCGESTGTRCMEPNLVFLECMDADADPCEGLGEEDCWRRPSCEAEYTQDRNDCLLGTRCVGSEPEFVGCHLKQDQCQTADDCYNLDFAAPECEGFYFTCEEGRCVEHCEGNECRSDEDCSEGEDCVFDEWCGDEEWCGVGHCEPANTGCESDEDCAMGERCEIRCGNGWCEGQCVADENYCDSDEDCPDGFVCELLDGCAPGSEDCYPYGVCVEQQEGCQTDADCDEGEVCIFDDYCDDDEYCGVGHCEPANTGCESDDDCAMGERCEIRCGNGWCEGQCVADENYCDSDEDCPDGFVCELLDGCAPGSEDCYPYGVCVEQQEGCQTDADCEQGEICVFDTNCGPDENCGMGRCVRYECQSNEDCGEGEVCVFDDWCEPDEWCGFGHCEPANTGCESDEDCAMGERCEIRCGNGWCEGQCVQDEPYCQTDDDCAEGSYCEQMLCDSPEGCPSMCSPGVWTFTEPVQCGGNPWEIDEADNPGRYEECYIDCEGMDCGSPAWEELCKVRTYFSFQGIVIHDLRDVWQAGDTCDACSCPRGDVIYALVAPYQLDALLSYGFSEYMQDR